MLVLRKLRRTTRKLVSRSASALIHGPVFRRLAPQAPAAARTVPLHIAVVDLIPSLGDAVMMFPLLDALQRDRPHALIEVFGSGSGSILAHHPAVTAYHQHCKSRPFAEYLGICSDVLDIWREWRKRWSHLRFHLCVVLRGGADPSQSAHLAWMLGGERRFGYSRDLEPERREHDTGENALLTDLVTSRGGVHEITRGAEVLTLAGLLDAPVPLDTASPSLVQIALSEEGQAYVRLHPELSTPYAVVGPGASVARRRWSEEGFAKLAEREIVGRGWTVVLLGSDAERPLCNRIANALSKPALVLTGTTFAELAAICHGAKLFLGNDSGPGHVAGALGIPTLEVTAFASSGDPYHHASPNRSHPSGPRVRVVQPVRQLLPCREECTADDIHCIAQVSVAQMQCELQHLLYGEEKE